MNRKLTVLALAAVLALAIVVPSLAQPATVSPRVSSALSQRAMRMARTSLRTARSAKRQSRAAEELAQSAEGTAKAASASAAATQAALNATHVVSGVVAAAATTESETLVALPGGPSVDVTVPASGLIEVWAQARTNESGAVSLFEDGKPMAGQLELEPCGGKPGAGILFSGGPVESEPTLLIGTPGTITVAGICATLGPPGPVLFQTTPGQHSYELRYESCGCAGPSTPVTFSDRRLFVAPRP
jgi:hypothetical protein